MQLWVRVTADRSAFEIRARMSIGFAALPARFEVQLPGRPQRILFMRKDGGNHRKLVPVAGKQCAVWVWVQEQLARLGAQPQGHFLCLQIAEDGVYQASIIR